MKKDNKKMTLPKPVRRDSRTCFGVNFYATEAEAEVAAAAVRRRGDTYNGGWCHGMPCGRDFAWDHVDDEIGPLFAVTTR